MTEIQHFAPPAPAVSDLPAAAHALVEWAQSAEAAYTLAERLCDTAFAPAIYKRKPVEAAAAILAGAEVGLSPMAALRAFDVIQGIAAPRAITVRAIAQSQGHEIITDSATEDKVVMRGKRKGTTEWQSVTWTIQRAAKLGLTGKDQWKKQPQTMLIARATTELVRLIAADAILGIGYSVEELDDDDQPTTKVSRSAASTRVSRAKPAEAPVEVEAVADDTATEPITKKQLVALNAAVSDLGLDRDAKLAGCSKIIGREIASTNDLTKAEASHVIDSLVTALGANEVIEGEVVEPTNDQWDAPTEGAES